MEESFNQGDEEKKLGLDISPLGDRENVCVEKCQVGVSIIDTICPLVVLYIHSVYYSIIMYPFEVLCVLLCIHY